MADNRTMKELLQAPTKGYGEAIVIPEINAAHFEIKTNLLQLVQANPYHGFERENPHTHINNFKRITSTLKFRDVPNDDLVNKFVNQFFPPSKTTHLKIKISHFTQRFEEMFGEAWERFKEMLRACPHHGFTKLAQIDTFYNGLNDNDQDSLNAAAGGNLLSKTTREALQIIENKSKVRYSINKPNVSRMNTTSRDNASKSDDRIDKLADQISTLVDIFAKKIVTPAPVKAVEESCVTCGGKDCAKIIKKQSKLDKIKHEIERLHQKPDQRTFSEKVNSSQAKSQRKESARTRSNRRRVPNIVKPEIRTIKEIVLMADRTMEELLQAPMKGYGEAIVISEILAKDFEIKTNLLKLFQTNKFHGFERDNPPTHISNFKRMTATLKYWDVLNDAIKLMLFPYSLESAARILACPYHGFSELTQIDTFYNGLTEQDHDSLNAPAGGNLLNKTTREALKIIENKSKVRYSRRKLNVSRVNTIFRDNVSKTDDRIDKLADQISNLVEIVNKQVIAHVSAKAVEKTCVTCGGAHAYYDCIATDSNQPSVCATTGSYN
nr:reverse transcriptase domain-containing protein [Tanacetum cinerariifolium]